jgi:hypothetical protein
MAKRERVAVGGEEVPWEELKTVCRDVAARALLRQSMNESGTFPAPERGVMWRGYKKLLRVLNTPLTRHN